jgi:hypothetical protein
MLFQNLKAIGEDVSEICVLFCKYIYIFIYIDVEESRPPLWSSGQSSWLHNGNVLWFLWGKNWMYICYVEESRPPLPRVEAG